MKKVMFGLLLFLVLFSSCIDIEEQPNTPQGNLEALWQIMDERYCYFDEKGVDWNEVRARYCRQVGAMSNEQLFEVMKNMLSELRDGHVNLYTPFDVGRYWAFYTDYPTNFSDTLQRIYLGTDYRIAASCSYRILSDNIGYVRLPSFQYAAGEGNLDEVFYYLSPCTGLILDVRSNSGGQLTAAEQWAARFCNEKTLVGYMRHKTGKGHEDFSDLKAQYLLPSKGMRWQKKVVVLTNRSVYSAANEFVKYMKALQHTMVVGDSTGGGSGLPFSSELPNGWLVRYSACPMYDRNKMSSERGVAPNFLINQTDEDMKKGEDTLIEFARRLLRKG